MPGNMKPSSSMVYEVVHLLSPYGSLGQRNEILVWTRHFLKQMPQVSIYPSLLLFEPLLFIDDTQLLKLPAWNSALISSGHLTASDNKHN
ncbi:uncharacterized protein RSE6_09548 [Rhynchosporium secalis]|uniref:Uncharacterized protein n=1 Tax=Rhynchosporium secalis TaxID=38038 RepID=A0A1E1MI94_RHYSE|nr:uncharacterized protein RSE6_09548 [Rhynchosporium secalis]